MADDIGKGGYVTTNDGVRLHYLEAGSGKPLVMIPGWSQTAAQFKYQIASLHDRYRLIALDMRGHGESDKPGFGYKIAWLSKDLHDVLVALDLHEVTLPGHSMGCSVIWKLLGSVRRRAARQAHSRGPDAVHYLKPGVVTGGTGSVGGYLHSGVPV